MPQTTHPHGKQGQGQGPAFERIVETTQGRPVGCGDLEGTPTTQSRPPEALDQCTGVTGAFGTARNTKRHSWS